MLKNQKDSDSTNRYVILIAGVIIQFCAGILYMWSVFKQPVSDYLGWEASSSAFTASVMLVTFVLGILIGGRVLDKIGPKVTCIVGSLMLSLGILTSSFVPSSAPSLIYLTYGIVGGFGVGMVYTCTVSPIQKWFFDKRGFATGLMVGAFGFSLVIFAPLANYLISTVDVMTTFQIFGLAFLLVCIPASLFIKNPSAEYISRIKGPSSPSQQKQYTTKEMLKTKSFYLITLSLFLVLPAFFILNPMAITIATERGLSSTMATMGVMIIGICSASGRLFITWASDRIGRMMSLFVIGIMTIIGAVAAAFAQDVLFLACIAMIAFAFGGCAGIYATVTADHFGTQNMGSNYGLVMLGFGASALVFPFLSTQLSSGEGDYVMSFVLAAIACVGGMVCIFILNMLNKKNAGNVA